MSEKTILQTIKTMVTEYKAIYLLWKYAPCLLPKEYKTFNELRDNYKMFPNGITESQASKWLLEESVQKAEIYILDRLHQAKMVTLYNVFFKQALEGDVPSFKAFNDFSKDFFVNKPSSEIDQILDDIDFND